MKGRVISRFVVTAACLLAAAWPGPIAQAGHSTIQCAACHVMHNTANPNARGMWSTPNTSQGLPTYTLYSSATFDALGTDISQPDGSSKLCLSCHDGSYSALRGSENRNLVFLSGDLAQSHPISFTYDSALATKVGTDRLKDPSVAQSGLGGTIAQDLLDKNSKLQCTSCHQVHSNGVGPYMLRFPYNPSNGSDKLFCGTCHLQ